jgi:iron complex outermembrane receptor protein
VPLQFSYAKRFLTAFLLTVLHLWGVSTHGQEAARAGLEEIVITATRVETNLQETPMSVVAFTGADLELGKIDNGYDLGIMTPNVAINPRNDGDSVAQMTIRGLPGVATYVDGAWFGIRFSAAQLRRARAHRNTPRTARHAVRPQQ